MCIIVETLLVQLRDAGVKIPCRWTGEAHETYLTSVIGRPTTELEKPL